MAASDEKAAEAEARATAEALGRETIDPAEAAWLAKRILQDDTIDENERALLVFLKKEAKAIDPALKPLFARAKLRRKGRQMMKNRPHEDIGYVIAS